MRFAIIKCTIGFLTNSADNTYKVNVYIDKNASVIGELYCEGNLELKGNIAGTVYTHLFVARERGTTYINHLYDGTINCSQLNKMFAGLLFKGESKSVVKWLY